MQVFLLQIALRCISAFIADSIIAASINKFFLEMPLKLFSLFIIVKKYNRNLEKPESMKELTGPRKIRLTSNLVSVIDIMMSVPEKATDMPIGSVLPWLVLFSVIKWYASLLSCESEIIMFLQKKRNTDLIIKLFVRHFAIVIHTNIVW